MIKNYSDHAANERTFLAWLRTGLSIAAFGFVVQRFNLFLAEFASIVPQRSEPPGTLIRLFKPLGRFDGLALSAIGVVIMVIGAVNLVRTAREIERPETLAASGPRVELMVTGVLAFLASAFCLYLAAQ
jgi:putative membrane protein